MENNLEIIKICAHCGPLTLSQVRIKVRLSGKSAGKKETICLVCAKTQNALRARNKDPELLKQHRQRYRYKYRDENTKEIRCSSCKETKAISGFNPSMLNIRAPYCIPCMRAACQKSKEKHYITSESARLKRHYGISLDDYNIMLASQNHVCAICKKSEMMSLNGKTRKLSVDHSHKTGLTRELLCFRCNACVGILEKNINAIPGALEYLEKHK